VTEEPNHVFITGGTGYVGSRLIPVLQRQGCTVRALVRAGSERKLPPGCEVVVGNALDRTTFESAIEPYSTFVQLVGVPHPSPAKAQQFYDIDLVSARASIDAAAARRVDHFVYLSVAQPAPIMKAYQLSRAIAEGHLAQTGLTSSVIRPWYVLGPGHRWPTLGGHWQPESSKSEKVGEVAGHERTAQFTALFIRSACLAGSVRPCLGRHARWCELPGASVPRRGRYAPVHGVR